MDNFFKISSASGNLQWAQMTKLHVILQGEEHLQMQWMLAGFLFKLLKEIYKFEDAVDMYNIYLIQFQELRKKLDTISKKKSQGALAFMSYLHGYLKLCDFWQVWSPAGFHEAARLLNISEDFLPHTTNHLKSFNHCIKSKYFASYQHSGCLPCIDVWVVVLITKELQAKCARVQYMLEMHHAAQLVHSSTSCYPTNMPQRDPPLSRSSNISLMLLDVQIGAAEDLDTCGELEWMEDICDSGANEDTDMEGEEFDAHFGNSHLVISLCRLEAHIQLSTPEPVSPVELPHIQLVDRFDEMSWEECVLDNNGILAYLRASKPLKLDVDYSDLFGSSPLSTPPSTVLSLAPSPPLPVTPSKPTTTSVDTGSDLGSINSKHAIAMQNILCAEDDLVKPQQS
ncbi:hypothetical protein V8B97DRAFT_1919445 [Scleroderma yunnanense]